MVGDTYFLEHDTIAPDEIPIFGTDRGSERTAILRFSVKSNPAKAAPQVTNEAAWVDTSLF